MNTAAKALLFALDNLQGRTGFSSTGASPFFFPDLAVEGIGEIAFPLSAQQAHAFTRLAEAAPYGKGTKTKHDESVRKCWQLDAKYFSFKTKAWNKFRKASRIAAALARLKPVEISKWEAQKSREPIPPGDLDESRVILAASHCLTQKADIAAAIAFLKSDASLFAVRKLIGPLFTNSANINLLAESTAAMDLLQFCKDALAKEIARPLVPYPDWRRPCPPVPKERYPQHFYSRKEPYIPVLEELAAFMADPATKELAIRRREDQRMIAEEFIRTHFLDLDCKTLRQGTPHTLLCTKNDRSHQHELEWRKIGRNHAAHAAKMLTPAFPAP